MLNSAEHEICHAYSKITSNCKFFVAYNLGGQVFALCIIGILTRLNEVLSLFMSLEICPQEKLVYDFKLVISVWDGNSKWW